MYHPGSKKNSAKKKLPCERIHTLESISPTRKKENKKSASPAAATATPRHDAFWTIHKNTAFLWRKKQPNPRQDHELLLARIICFRLDLLDFCWWKKSLIRIDSDKKITSVFKGWENRSSLESLPLERTILGPPSSLKVSFIVTKAQSGLDFFGGWGSDTCFFGKVFTGSDLLVGKLKWRIRNKNRTSVIS